MFEFESTVAPYAARIRKMRSRLQRASLSPQPPLLRPSVSLPRRPLPGAPYLPLLQLVLFFFFFFAASSAHALASRRSGLHGALPAAAGEEGEQVPLPPPPSEELLARMHRHNVAFNYGYPFWNVTDLDAASCQRLANETAAERASEDASCIPDYRCDFDRLRYPHWLIFTACSRGPAPCDPAGRPEDEWRFSCYPHAEDVLLLRYVDLSGTNTWSRRKRRRRRRSNGGAAGSTFGGEGAREAAPERLPDAGVPAAAGKPSVMEEDTGEWQLWFYQVPSECRCYV